MNLKRTGSPNLSLNIEIASATILCPAGREHMRVRICKRRLDQVDKKCFPPTWRERTLDLLKLDMTQTETVNRPEA